MSNDPTPPKLKKADLVALISERERIEAFLTPPPPPPPDPVKVKWEEKAKARKAEIDAVLAPYFFPKIKEGSQRKSKFGFHALAKYEITRKLDVAALADVVAKCQEVAAENEIEIDVESKVIDWKPKLKLEDYRKLPAEIKHAFDHALIISTKPLTFDVVSEGGELTEEENSE